jgi:hypothetical protein
MLQVLGSGKACEQQLLHLKDRCVLPGINHINNALQWCVVDVCQKLKLVVINKAKKIMTVQGY